MRKKYVGKICAFFVAILLLVLSCRVFSRSKCIEVARKSLESSVTRDVYRSFEEDYLFSDREGTIFELRKNGRLLMWNGVFPQMVANTDRAFPTNRGVAYFKNDTLCYFDGNMETIVAEKVVCASWDGQSFFWLDKDTGAVYSLNGDKREILPIPAFDYSTSQMVMLASEQYILVTPVWLPDKPQHLLCYDRIQNKIQTFSIHIDKYDANVLINNFLLSSGESTMILDLSSGTQINFDLDIIASQGTVRAGTIYLQESDLLYYSVCSQPELPWFYAPSCGTFQIDCETFEIQKIAEKYYPNMFMTNGCLFGIRGASCYHIK